MSVFPFLCLVRKPDVRPFYVSNHSEDRERRSFYSNPSWSFIRSIYLFEWHFRFSNCLVAKRSSIWFLCGRLIANTFLVRLRDIAVMWYVRLLLFTILSFRLNPRVFLVLRWWWWLPLTLVQIRQRRRGGRWRGNTEEFKGEEWNADYGRMVQPSQQHNAACVKMVVCRHNVDRQNVDRHNFEQTKCRQT